MNKIEQSQKKTPQISTKGCYFDPIDVDLMKEAAAQFEGLKMEIIGKHQDGSIKVRIIPAADMKNLSDFWELVRNIPMHRAMKAAGYNQQKKQ